MLNRRTFITSSLAAVGTVTLSSAARAEQPRAKSLEVGGYNYRLPSFKKVSRLLFQGDSITDMKWGRNQSDRNHYLGHSYVYLIAARLGVDMPEAQLAKDYNAVHIKTQDIFDAAAKAVSPEHWIWDGIHPLPQDHELIARNWLQEVSARWPQT